ncbi:hypothetical protein EXIGLDRAFT_838888 [Exidia glandulosa HHB12029]|uniref:Aminoglycoside phosphotransferase domain-containing protein n=1 Tax=Exidia glandulosa HHB12029 TaxID=1314781 RepID=A0A165FF63_EXIGL|nr:hypothetical protein EXIGLDRAFT_838888 [Exidia glandulosa HHB12029]
MAEESQSSLGLSINLGDAQTPIRDAELPSRPPSTAPTMVETSTDAADIEFDIALSIPLLDDSDEDLAWYAEPYEDGDEERRADDSATAGPTGAAALEAYSPVSSHITAPPPTPAVALHPARGIGTRGVNTRALAGVVFSEMSKKVIAVDVVARDEWRKTCNVTLEDHSEITMLVYNPVMPKTVVESEVATIAFISSKTTIPAPRVLHYSPYNSRTLGPYAILEKVKGVRLDLVFEQLPPFEQELVVVQFARWMVELDNLPLSAIGSLFPSDSAAPKVGQLLHLPFYASGRATLPIDRGPFASSRDYFLACAQREIDSSRALFTQGQTSVDYQQQVEDGRMQAERAAALVMNIVERCDELEEDDVEMDRFALDIHTLPMKSFIVDPSDPTRIVAITDWHKVSSRPLWRRAQVPGWIAASSMYTSSSFDSDLDKERLERVFRAAVRADAGAESPFARALEGTGDTRHALDDACDFDAVTDGFLLLPTLESIAATLPGNEDVDALAALLDPSTLSGRAARINIVTQGMGTLALVAPNREPSPIVGNPMRPYLVSVKSM